MRPSPSTPAVTGESCGVPSARVVDRIIRCRGRRNSSSSFRSTRSAVAILAMVETLPYPATRALPVEDAASPCRAGLSGVSRAVEESNRRLLRARDAMDRAYAEPLDVATLARIAFVSEAHFIRAFRATFGETPNRYLQRRRVERAMFLLRSTARSVTDICMDVGFSSLGTFSRVFRDVVGEPPSAYRRRGPLPPVPSCFAMAWLRPSSFGEAPRE